MEKRETVLRQICRCPYCQKPLTWTREECRCEACRRTFPRTHGHVIFQDPPVFSDKEQTFHMSLIENTTFFARTLNRIRKIITSEYEPLRQTENFVKNLSDDQIVVECGSGNRRLTPTIINVDAQAFEQVDVVTTIAKLPFADESVDAVIFDKVLEHVPDPQACIDEGFRVLRKGGRVLCVTPFVFPYHPYPKHYWNYTEDGLRHLLRAFTSCSVETNMGPTSALINLLSEYCAVACSGKSSTAYVLMKGTLTALLFPFKFIDRLWCHSKRANRIAMCLVAIGEK